MRRPWGPGAVEGGGVHMGMQARSRPRMVAASVEAAAGAAGDQRGGRRATRPDVGIVSTDVQDVGKMDTTNL